MSAGPVVWGLAVAGAAGVAQVIGHLRAELELALTLSGAARLGDLSPEMVRPEGCG